MVTADRRFPPVVMATCAVATKLLVVQQQWNLLCQRQFAPNISMPVISVAPASCRPWVAEKSIPAGDAVETGNAFRAHGRGYSACTETDLRELGEKFEKAASTRPHPAAPDRPPVDMIIGPGGGLIDRLRDALTGRGG
ncbi:hypothetical protein JNN96_02880 [Mycobacterium sp. DSM 3803]|nr:hypothetical protein [Mycobacterium sp. DSM 3803]